MVDRTSLGRLPVPLTGQWRMRCHELEGRKLGVPGFELAGETPKLPVLRVGVRNYLARIKALQKPNT
jgi:hypothetical protein